MRKNLFLIFALLIYEALALQAWTIAMEVPPDAVEANLGLVTAPMQSVTSIDAPGGHYIATATRDSGSAVYNFNIVQSGTYKIIANVYATNWGDDSFLVKIDNDPEDIWDLNPGADPVLYNVWRQDEVTARGTGTVDAPQLDPLAVQLAAGSHTITVSGREANARLASLFLMLESAAVPPPAPEPLPVLGPSSSILLFRADSGELTPETMEIVSGLDIPGGSYIGPSFSNSGSAVYNFNIDNPGTYKIVGEVYAADNVSDSFFVTIDNNPEDIWDLNPGADPALYNVWRQDEVTARGTGTVDAPQFDPLQVELGEGTHTIEIKGRELNSRLAYFYLMMLPVAGGTEPYLTGIKFPSTEAESPPAPAPPPPSPSGPTINASSCAFSAVQAAVNSAGIGTTVKIPGGDCNWGTQQLNVPGGVYLLGNGREDTSEGKATILRRVGAVSSNSYLIAYNCSNGNRAILSDMTLIGNGDSTIDDKGLGLLNGCQDFKVSNSKFTNFIFSALYVGDAANQRGVIYKNNFINNYHAKRGNLGYGVVVYGGGAWPALDLGSKNAVFVEENYFSGQRHDIASNNGSVYVFRYNTVVGQDPAKDFAQTDAHGLSSSKRGSRSYEIYNNAYSTNISSGLQRTAIGIRGGDGVIFNNTMTETIARPIELTQQGFSCGFYPGPDQIRSLYIWNNSNYSNSYQTGGVDNDCPSSIGLNRDYFLKAKDGYFPYAYPHPLRSEP